MKKFVGKGVCSAAACGKIKIFTGGEIHADKVSVTDTENQKKRLSRARNEAVSQLDGIYKKGAQRGGRN